MHQALYRKYRPRSFDDVCGQEHITSVLKYETENGKTSHAYLFCGSRGTGKTTCAKILAKAVNCENPINGNPCCKCRSCLDIDTDAATDVLEMDAASNNGVDYIREIRDEVVFTPAMLKKRVYIIDEVHMLSTSAFNALLKTLEEPPEHVVFILATTELHKLPATIISRCQRFDFRRISVSVIVERLHYIAQQEEIKLENDAAIIIAKQAQGGMRDAISLFELCSGGGSDVTAKRVSEILGISGYEQMHDTVIRISKGDMPSLFKIVSDVVSSSKDISVFLSELISFYRDMLISKYVSDAASYLDLTSTEKDLLVDASSKLGLQTIIYHCNVLDDAMQSIVRSPSSKRTTLEFALMRLCEPRLDTSEKALASRLEVLEDKFALLSVSSHKASANVTYDPDTANMSEEKRSESTVDVSSADEYQSLYDISDVTDKLFKTNSAVAAFMSSAETMLSSDKRTVMIKVGDAFAHMMISKDDAQNCIADAFALTGITDGKPLIKVILSADVKKKASPSDELFGNN